MIKKTCPTWEVQIYIAGDLDEARRVCRRYVMVGLCVTVEPVEYIYTGGSEMGVRVGLINYPRFPATANEINNRARQLADLLMEELCQNSYTIVFPDMSEFVSRKPEDQK